MLKNAYLDAKFCVDTAENEPFELGEAARGACGALAEAPGGPGATAADRAGRPAPHLAVVLL